jgi:hypothetical protein
VRTGITGHQELGDDSAVSWVRETLRRLVRTESVTVGLSSLAEGADQLFAQLVLAAGLPLVAVIPCSGYEATFGSVAARETFLRLRAAAAERVLLDHPAPTEEAFWAAGREIVERCELLLAVWDGAAARGLGGTADVVRYARERGRRVLHVHPASRSVRELGPASGGAPGAG